MTRVTRIYFKIRSFLTQEMLISPCLAHRTADSSWVVEICSIRMAEGRIPSTYSTLWLHSQFPLEKIVAYLFFPKRRCCEEPVMSNTMRRKQNEYGSKFTGNGFVSKVCKSMRRTSSTSREGLCELSSTILFIINKAFLLKKDCFRNSSSLE